MKNQYFWSGFFLHQGMDLYFNFRTSRCRIQRVPRYEGKYYNCCQQQKYQGDRKISQKPYKNRNNMLFVHFWVVVNICFILFTTWFVVLNILNLIHVNVLNISRVVTFFVQYIFFPVHINVQNMTWIEKKYVSQCSEQFALPLKCSEHFSRHCNILFWTFVFVASKMFWTFQNDIERMFWTFQNDIYRMFWTNVWTKYEMSDQKNTTFLLQSQKMVS